MGNCGGRIISAVWEKQSANSDVAENRKKCPSLGCSVSSDHNAGPGWTRVTEETPLHLDREVSGVNTNNKDPRIKFQ